MFRAILGSASERRRISMPLNSTMWAMTLGELGLWAALSLVFWNKKLQKRLPAMGWYLALRAISSVVFLALLFIHGQSWGHWALVSYFYVYYANYCACTVLVFLVSVEVFRSALTGFSGIQRFGSVIFRWAALASLIISFSTVSFTSPDWRIVPEIAYRLMRSVSIIELCLLGFLCLSMNALKLSPRDLSFGIAFGLGIFSSSDFIFSAFQSWRGTLTDSSQFVGQGVTLFALSIWLV